MKAIFKSIFHVLGLTFLLILLAVSFYHLSNDYFAVNNEMRDYSLYAWAMLAVIWLFSLWRWYKGDKKVLFFAVGFSALCALFDCYRYAVYLKDDICLHFMQVVFAAEVLILIGAAVKKQRFLIVLLLALIIVTLAIPYLMFPPFKVKILYMMAGAGVLLWATSFVAGKLWQKKHKVAAFLTVLLPALLWLASVAWAVWTVYEKMPGIHFYEKPYTKEVKNVQVSIVVPAYNAEDTLEKTLDSLRFQTLKKIEIIVVDDGSTDKTSEILKKYAAHDVRFTIIRQKNAYAGAARNRGLIEARGEYVGFVDADDIVSPNYFKSLYQTAKLHDADVAIAETVYTVYMNEDGRKKLYSERQEYTRKGVVTDLADYRRNIYPFLWDKIYRRSFLIKNHILCSTRRSPTEDHYLTTQVMMYADKMYVAKDAVYYYMKRNKSLTVVEHEKLSNQIEYVFSDLDDLIDGTDFDADKKALWHDVVNANRHAAFDVYYSLLRDEDKELGLKKLQKKAPDWKPKEDKAD